MNSVGYKIKKTILYTLLILLGAACLFPFCLWWSMPPEAAQTL